MKPKATVERLPMIPLRGVVPFPTGAFTVDLARESSIASAVEALSEDSRIFLVAQRDAKNDRPGKADVFETGVIARVKHMMPQGDQTFRILVEGDRRAKLTELLDMSDKLFADVIPVPYIPHETDARDRAYMGICMKLCRGIADGRGMKVAELLDGLDAEENVFDFCYAVNAAFISAFPQRQTALEENDPSTLLQNLPDQLAGELSICELEARINRRVQEAMERANHEYYLHEQINVIREELGENEGEEIAAYRKKLATLNMPEEARDKTERELRHLAHAAPQSPEASVSQNYIEYMLELPWGKRDSGVIDLKKARRVLDEDHYGLQEVKQRLIEFLAVRRHTGALKSPIICLVGPPGVGKTSIAASVARALGRKFTQVSLGGVHDEAEIRGHRKTYIGAMPGRIISSIHRCGSMNPVFLLDEIDKLAHDMRGDPASALLEALDPAQNTHFKDHYIEAPFDLSDVLFITTANSTDPIDRALLDRMEVIEVPSYTADEKRNIAIKYLLPKQLKAHGLEKGSVRVPAKVMDELIDGYTREAGVRELERVIEKLCRKAAVAFLSEDPPKRVSPKKEDLAEWLGAKRYLRTPLEENGRVGVVNGLAWTSVGGEVMPVEALFLPGKGVVELTGQLGDVMKESAKLACSIVRNVADEYGVAQDLFEKHDLHVHVPEGATPKDGPSAGVALSASLLSAAANLPARADIAMTGEVTLHGRVLAIGGLREKLMAAYRGGIRQVLIPEENVKDLEKLDPAVLEKLTVTPIRTVREAFGHIFAGR